ncbi:MAG: NADH-quinone oxidoreductase subunit N [bacterium]
MPLIEFLKTHPSYAFIFPELWLTAAGLAMIFFDLFVRESRKTLIAWFGIASLSLAAAFVIFPAPCDHRLVSAILKDMIADDGFASFFKLVILTGAFLVIVLSTRYVRLTSFTGEYYSLIILSTAAMMLLVSSVNLLMIYLCIEFVGICSYVLCAYHKDDPKSSEGAIKYLLLGALASAFLVYGISLLYGLTGSLNLIELPPRLAARETAGAGVVSLAVALLVAAFGFKVALVPFHMWSPDAYEGAPTPITAFLSVLPKAAGIAVLTRVFLTAFSGVSSDWVHVLEVLAILTMTIGNVTAVWQSNIKRMLAYSSIAHVGYVLIGVVVAGALGVHSPLGRQGTAAVLIYVAAYLFMNLGAFAVVIAVSNAVGSDLIERCSGLSRRAPALAVLLTFFFLSLAGIPPTAGFIGKFFLFKAAIETEFYLLALAAIVNSVISVYYYWNVVRLMFIAEPPEPAPIRTPLPIAFALSLSAAAVLALGILFQPLINLASNGAIQTALLP